MIKTINYSNYSSENERIKDSKEFRSFLDEFNLDGIELLICEKPNPKKLPLEKVQGIHLSSFNSWIDFWRGDEEKVLEEYGSMEVIKQYYGGRNPICIYNKYKEQLDYAQKIGAKYVVFHICDVGLDESLTKKFKHTDEEVVDISIEFINKLLDDTDYTFDFLMENLWWPGMTFRRPEIVERLLNGVHYKNKGLMLDTGHLMNLNPDLKSSEEGLEFIKKVLKENEKIIPMIKGVHLHQSLSSLNNIDMEKILRENVGDYWTRWGKTFEYIFLMDEHKPFQAEGIDELLYKIDPKYCTLEYITRSHKELKEYLNLQSKYLKGI